MRFLARLRRPKSSREPPNGNPLGGRPRGRILFSTPAGPVILTPKGRLAPYATRRTPFLDLAPLFKIPDAQEIMLRVRHVGGKDIVRGMLTTSDRRYAVEFSIDRFERVVEEIVATTGIPLSLANPVVMFDYDGWRIELAMPTVGAGEWSLIAAKLRKPPDITHYGEILAARLVTLSLTKLCTLISGEPGSGKTTLLNSILLKVVNLFPQLHVYVVERAAELVIPDDALNVSRRIGQDIWREVNRAITAGRVEMLVVGEIRADELDFVEAARSGVPTLATIHGPSALRALEAIALHARRVLGPITVPELSRLLPVHVEMEKAVGGNISRRVKTLLISNGRRLAYIYRRGIHAGDQVFTDLISPYDTIVGASPEDLYESLKQVFGITRKVTGASLGFLEL